jgi:UDP-N-acetylglucosamine--N-acetylmuramyl-(pentapeptide) pyrophosphoryl-undecaprenol N-acetylglucosamine transferase
MPGKVFVMAGGGTGGHVIPSLAVACELRRRGHEVFFVGTDRGVEARLVPAAGFELQLIRIGALKRVGAVQRLETLGQLPLGTLRMYGRLRRWKTSAVFSMGGYVAGPVVMAALIARKPVVVMEPNAVPGFTNRRIGGLVTRALVSFPETSRYFRRGRTEVTGLPVRQEFFTLPQKQRENVFSIFVTGGSQGSRTLNRAARESWPLFGQVDFPIRFVLQTGQPEYETLGAAFAQSKLRGEVKPFIEDMPSAFAEADLVICRSGAGAVAELAAAGKPSVLVPFPFAADDHQLHNAQAFESAAAAKLVLDRELTGAKLFELVTALARDREALERMGSAARRLAHPGAAARAAEILEEVAQ